MTSIEELPAGAPTERRFPILDRVVDEARAGSAPGAITPVEGGAGAPSGLPAPRPRVSLPKARKNLRCLTVRVEVDDVVPTVWRQVELRSDLTVERLHGVLQAAFGWSGGHLHQFCLGPVKDVWGGPFLAGVDDAAPADGADAASGHEADVVLDQVFRQVGDQLFYVYDFGDEWVLTLTLECATDADGDLAEAWCLSGENAGPLEDCGGAEAYSALLAAWRSVQAVPAAALWPGWQPEEFSVAAVNDALQPDETAQHDLMDDLLDERRVDVFSPVGRLADVGSPATRNTLWQLAADAREHHERPTDAARAHAARPWNVLLTKVLSRGVRLRKGQLPPEIIAELTAELLREVHDADGGTAMLDTSVLRECLQQWRFARTFAGWLRGTKRGEEAWQDPDVVWRHLAVTLVPPEASDEIADACATFLLLVASGRPGAEVVRATADLLGQLGWRREGRATLSAADAAAMVQHPLSVLRHVDRAWASGPTWDFSPTARALAYEALGL